MNGARLCEVGHPLKCCKWAVQQNTVRAFLEPGLVGGFHGSIAAGVGVGGVGDVFVVRFAGVAKFLADSAFVRDIPAMEETV
jgi:hypothetical protein